MLNPAHFARCESLARSSADSRTLNGVIELFIGKLFQSLFQSFAKVAGPVGAIAEDGEGRADRTDGAVVAGASVGAEMGIGATHGLPVEQGEDERAKW